MVCLATGEVFLEGINVCFHCTAVQCFLFSLVAEGKREPLLGGGRRAEVSPTLGRPGEGRSLSPENSLWLLIHVQLTYHAPVSKACLNILKYFKK